MIRNEIFNSGKCIHAEIIDLEAGTVSIEENGVVVTTRPITSEEIRTYGPQPLNPIGAAATLNVVVGVWDITDAANIAGVTEQDLINEALAWQAAADNN